MNNKFMTKIAQKLSLDKVLNLVKDTFNDYIIKQDKGEFKLKGNASITVSNEFVGRGITIIYDPGRDVNFNFGIRNLEIETIDELNLINWLDGIKKEYAKEVKIPVIKYEKSFRGETYYFDFYSNGEIVDTLSFDSEEYNKNKSKVIDTLEKHKKDLEFGRSKK